MQSVEIMPLQSSPGNRVRLHLKTKQHNNKKEEMDVKKNQLEILEIKNRAKCGDSHL